MGPLPARGNKKPGAVAGLVVAASYLAGQGDGGLVHKLADGDEFDNHGLVLQFAQ